MSSATGRSKVFIGVDGSTDGDAAIGWAARDASMRSLPVTLIHVVAASPANSMMGPDGTMTQRQEDQARQIVERARRIVGELGGQKGAQVHTEVAYAGVVSTLIDASKDAQMVVVGSRGRGGVGRQMLGSVAWRLIKHAHCPVAVVHDPDTAQHEINGSAPVLVGIDGSPAADAATALALAFDQASRRGVPVVALHAWSDVGVFPLLGMDWRKYRDQGQEVLGERLAGWHEQYPDVPVHRRLVCDVPARWLLDESKNAQLVVLGSRGRGGFPGMRLGSVTSRVVRSAPVPVIVVPNCQ
jgi:nucleotide-binding universal stress UspA family protein